jgi:hypothetical protein
MDTLASKGWMVKVATAGHSGGAPVEQFYAAGYYRMNDAERDVPISVIWLEAAVA